MRVRVSLHALSPLSRWVCVFFVSCHSPTRPPANNRQEPGFAHQSHNRVHRKRVRRGPSRCSKCAPPAATRLALLSASLHLSADVRGVLARCLLRCCSLLRPLTLTCLRRCAQHGSEPQPGPDGSQRDGTNDRGLVHRASQSKPSESCRRLEGTVPCPDQLMRVPPCA